LDNNIDLKKIKLSKISLINQLYIENFYNYFRYNEDSEDFYDLFFDELCIYGISPKVFKYLKSYIKRNQFGFYFDKNLWSDLKTNSYRYKEVESKLIKISIIEILESINQENDICCNYLTAYELYTQILEELRNILQKPNDWHPTKKVFIKFITNNSSSCGYSFLKMIENHEYLKYEDFASKWNYFICPSKFSFNSKVNYISGERLLNFGIYAINNAIIRFKELLNRKEYIFRKNQVPSVRNKQLILKDKRFLLNFVNRFKYNFMVFMLNKNMNYSQRWLKMMGPTDWNKISKQDRDIYFNNCVKYFKDTICQNPKYNFEKNEAPVLDDPRLSSKDKKFINAYLERDTYNKLIKASGRNFNHEHKKWKNILGPMNWNDITKEDRLRFMEKIKKKFIQICENPVYGFKKYEAPTTDDLRLNNEDKKFINSLRRRITYNNLVKSVGKIPQYDQNWFEIMGPIDWCELSIDDKNKYFDKCKKYYIEVICNNPKYKLKPKEAPIMNDPRLSDKDKQFIFAFKRRMPYNELIRSVNKNVNSEYYNNLDVLYWKELFEECGSFEGIREQMKLNNDKRIPIFDTIKGNLIKFFKNDDEYYEWYYKFSKGKFHESLVREIMKEEFNGEFPEKSPNWLGTYRLDGFNEELKIAFEYNGEQHYIYTPFFHDTMIDFEKQKARDKEVLSLCKKNGVILLVIPYWIVVEEIRDYIKQEYEFAIRTI
jgi:hypothetical protein